MLLLDFPIEFCSVASFEAIANSVGKYIFFDPDSLRWCNKRMEWVLVEFDIYKGLPKTIEIVIGDRVMGQPIDYWKESFCSHMYGQPGHLKANCMSDLRPGHSQITVTDSAHQASPSQPPLTG